MSETLREQKIAADIFPMVLVVFVIWTIATMGIGVLMTGGGDASLEDLVRDGVMWSAFVAMIFAIAVVFFFRVRHEVGIKGLTSKPVWIVAIVPAVIIVLFLMRSFSSSAFTSTQILWICINTLFVGISEELMFRGLLLSGLYKRYSYWVAIIGVSLLFGAVHVLNGLVTGDFIQGLFQAGMATFSGLTFMAIRLGMGSIIPAMILHWLWDFSIFLNGGIAIDPDNISAFGTVVALLLVSGPVILGIVGIIFLFRFRKYFDKSLASESE
jgi:hypothetical protein